MRFRKNVYVRRRQHIESCWSEILFLILFIIIIYLLYTIIIFFNIIFHGRENMKNAPWYIEIWTINWMEMMGQYGNIIHEW